MAASWCKVASNLDSHPKIRRAGRCGREVFLFALRRNAEPGNPNPGRISAEELDSEYVSDQLQMPVTDAVTGVTAAVTAGLLVKDGDSYVITSWKDGWGKDGGTGAERTAKWRENKKLQTGVTDGDTRDVTRDRRDSGDTEEKRLEEKRKKKPADSAGLKELKGKVDKAGRIPSRGPLPIDWSPKDSHRAKASAVGSDCDHEANEFRNGALANGRRYADWDAAFNTWLSNEAKWRAERGGNRQGGLQLVQPIRQSKPL